MKSLPVAAWEAAAMPVVMLVPAWVKSVLFWIDRAVWHPVPMLAGVALWLWTGDLRYAVLMLGAYPLEMLVKGTCRRGRWGDSGSYAAVHEYGFPSGDVVASTLLGLLAAAGLGGWWWAAPVLAPLVIGLARVVAHGHYPLDVAGGVILGVAWFAVVYGR